MSEQHTPRIEKQSVHEKSTDHHEHQKRLHEDLARKAEQAKQALSETNIEHIRKLAEAQAEESKTTRVEQSPDKDPDEYVGMQHSLKSNAYARSLKTVQQKLPKTVRTFSRITHSQVVDTVSNASAQTVARPSGILGGSICAFLGTLVVLYYSKHYGFRYNYLILFALFIAGYFVGGTIELLVWLLHGRRQNY